MPDPSAAPVSPSGYRRNQDEHTKNNAYLMDRDGRWSLAPAYDVTWAYNPEGDWTRRHQMTVNGKRSEFTRHDLMSVANRFGIRHGAAIVDSVTNVVAAWPEYAATAGGADEHRDLIAATLRLDIS